MSKQKSGKSKHKNMNAGKNSKHNAHSKGSSTFLSKVPLISSPKMSHKILGILIILAVIYLITSSTPVTVKENQTVILEQPKTKNESCMIEKEVKVAYTVKVPYGPKDCFNAPYESEKELSILNRVEDNEEGESTYYMVCEYAVTNLEKKAGTWAYRGEFTRADGRVTDAEVIEEEIGPNETYIFRWRMEKEKYGTVVSCSPKKVESPVIEKCEYQEPITYKNEKRYRNETRLVEDPNCKEVVEVDRQTVIVEREVQKCRNKIFGYTQPCLGY